MKFEEKIKNLPARAVWEEYCGFLDLSMEEYMKIQNRLLLEQIDLLASCELGRRFLGDTKPKTADEFRSIVPLTTYQDYADILLTKRVDMLPAEPIIWISTTWEGGDHPFKTAPYTKAMLEVYRNNILGCMILSTSRKKYSFKIKPNAKVLYSLAPLPYATGLYPSLVRPEIRIKFLPSLNVAKQLSFSARCKEGFRLSLKHGMDQFYGMTSIIYNMSKSFPLKGGSSMSLKDLVQFSPRMLYRILKAKYLSKRDNTPILPKDIFRLDGLVCVGTDTHLYKDELEEMWACRPLEVAGGTETCLLGTETWLKNGLIFFPDNCFYEFIPEQEMLRNLKDPKYIPQTYLMNELVPGEKYEIVITSLKGGAFVRYRVGDIYRCLRTSSSKDDVALPQFQYVDRVPNVIDIDGFTRITKREIERVIQLSRIPVADWFALKEYSDDHRSSLHIYVELDPDESGNNVADGEILKEHLSLYFKYFDSDYRDLKKLLGIDPLKVTVIPKGTIQSFESLTGTLPRINPSQDRVTDFRRFLNGNGPGRRCAL